MNNNPFNPKDRHCYCGHCQWWRRNYWIAMACAFMGIALMLAGITTMTPAGIDVGSIIFLGAAFFAMVAAKKIGEK